MYEKQAIRPRIIIHGGAGNIQRANLPPASYNAYRAALLSILDSANTLLSQPGVSSLDVATYAVSLLEDCPLFNCGHGAVFTTAGTNELEASVMVSRGRRKRGVGVMKVTKVKNPIMLAKNMLLEGNKDDGGGAHGHCQLEGETCHDLARQWGVEMCKPSYYWTKKRWDEHRQGLGLSVDSDTYQRDRHNIDHPERHSQEDTEPNIDVAQDPSWDGHEYLPQGTVGCVVLDATGVLCVATSTGGLTNKLPGRIGDTPTLGAGFWAEEWISEKRRSERTIQQAQSPLARILGGCLPSLAGYKAVDDGEESKAIIRAAAMSGTGNGDSFLRLAACRTAAAMAHFCNTSLHEAVTAMAGRQGNLQRSAEDRWLKSGEGEGGIIGIEFSSHDLSGDGGVGKVVANYNCGGMFRAWIDEKGADRMLVFREEYE